MKKRAIALWLTLAMILSVFAAMPISASAEGETNFRVGEPGCESFEAAVAAAVNALSSADEASVELTEDVVLAAPVKATIPDGKTLKIFGCGNGFSADRAWDYGTDANALLIVDGGGTLEIDTTHLNCRNTYSEPDCTVDAGFIYATDLTVRLDSVFIDSPAEGVDAVRFNVTKNISAESFYTLSASNCRIFEQEVNNGSAPTGIRLHADTDAALSACFFSEGDDYGWYTRISNIETEGDGTCNVFIYNGAYGFDPQNWLADELRTCNHDENDPWYCVDYSDKVVAMVAGCPFSSLQDAVNCIAEKASWLQGETYISLYRDFTLDKPVEINTAVTINGCDRTVTAGENLNGNFFSVTGEEEFKIFNVTLKGESRADGILLEERNGAYSEIYDCCFVGTPTAIAVDGSELNSWNCEYNSCEHPLSVKNTTDREIWCNLSDSDLAGTVAAEYTAGKGKINLCLDYCENVKLDLDSGFDEDSLGLFCGVGSYIDNPEAYMDTENYNLSGSAAEMWTVSVKPETAICCLQSSDEYFMDLQRCMNAAQDGDVVQLLQPCEVTQILKAENGKEFTIRGDRNKTVLWVNSERGFNDEGTGAFFLIRSGSRVTLDNVSMYISNATDHCVKVISENENEEPALTVNSAVLLASCREAIRNEGGTVVLRGGVFNRMDGLEDFLPEGENLCFFEDYEEDEGGSFRYDEGTQKYVEADENYSGTRYMQYFYVSYDLDKPYITLDGEKSVNIGSELTVKVHVHKNSGIAGMGLRVYYNNDHFALKDVSFEDAFDGNPADGIPNPEYYDDKNGTVQFAWGRTTNYNTEDFILATLTFTAADVSDEGEDSFCLDLMAAGDVSYKNISDENGNSIHFNFDSLTVQRIFRPGDVNGDQTVAVGDAQLLLKYLVGYPFDQQNWIADGRTAFNEDAFRAAADVDGDGELTVMDVVKLLRFAAGVFGEELC